MVRPSQLDNTTELSIINAVADGQDRTAILKRLKGVKNNTLGNWLLRLERAGYILKVSGSWPCMYELTYTGRQRHKELRNSKTLAHPGINEYSRTAGASMVCVDNYSVKYAIIKSGEIFTPSAVQMQGWVKQLDFWGDITIIKNGESSIELQPKPIYGDSADRLLMRARAICDSAAKLLQQQYGFTLGVGEVNREFSVEVANNITREMLNEYGYVRDRLDGSKMGGELCFNGRDPATAAQQVNDWLALPKDVAETRREVMYIRERLDITLSLFVKSGTAAPAPQPEQPQPPAPPAAGMYG